MESVLRALSSWPGQTGKEQRDGPLVSRSFVTGGRGRGGRGENIGAFTNLLSVSRSRIS